MGGYELVINDAPEESTDLQVADVNSARQLLHIHGKRKKDRYVLYR